MSRSGAYRIDKTPVMSDLRESGSIEECADTVMLLHRPSHFDHTKTDTTQLLVVKSRLLGDLGKIEYSYDKGRYIELPTIDSMMPNQTKISVQKKEEEVDNPFES